MDNGPTDAVFQDKFKDEHGYDIEEARRNDSEAAPDWAKIVFPGHSHSWESFEVLRKHWDGPIVLQGIQSVADARKYVEVGVQGIVVSNHGARQQDGGVSSLGMLLHIVEAVGDKLDLYSTVGFDVMPMLSRPWRSGQSVCSSGGRMPSVWLWERRGSETGIADHVQRFDDEHASGRLKRIT